MLLKIYGKFWYIIGEIEGLLYSVKCSFQFLRWSKAWCKEHPTADEEMYKTYAKEWWLERFPDTIDMV